MEDETTTTGPGAAGAAYTKAGKSSHEAGCSAKEAGETAGRPIDNGFTGMQGDADAGQSGLGTILPQCECYDDPYGTFNPKCK